MAADSNAGASGCGATLQIDEAYEFCAPGFFDFVNEETEEDIRGAELWFETSLSYAPSPFMPRIKERRSIKIESLCNFGDVAPAQKEQELMRASNPIESSIAKGEGTTCLINNNTSSLPTGNLESEKIPSFEFPIQSSPNQTAATATETSTPKIGAPAKIIPPTCVKTQTNGETCTPKAQQVNLQKGTAPPTSSKNSAARKIANTLRQLSSLKPKLPESKSPKSTNLKSVIKYPYGITGKNAMVNDIALENQAVKRQKLDNGRSRQILNVKSRMLPHKFRGDLKGSTDIIMSELKKYQDDVHSVKEVAPFISAAETVKKFESRTRDLEISHNISVSQNDTASGIQRRPKLVLTRPKEPELQTAHRVRAVRVKSTAELEEEMLAKIPKFKARPFNKAIVEAPPIPTQSRSTPQLPEFHEFHLRTMDRANRHADTCLEISSLDSFNHSQRKPLKLTEPKPPQLETALRARPPMVKSSQELELEQLKKMPKFKARPINRKILESKGDIGIFSHLKPQITAPKEFHFATNDRLGPPTPVMELFDKLSIHSGSSSHHEKLEFPRITVPNPFHLRTEERGHEKERLLAEQLLQKQLEEEKARIPKANPYPYTTDYPVVPPKPEPKPCTKPEAFQLESLVRHEEEMQRKLEERERMEKEEAQRRIFRAQPILEEDPIPLWERERKPLTDVQEFVLHVDHRSIQRSEFDKKIKEKEMMYKRLREECESAKMIEEEKARKQLRRTMVPHARPLPKFSNPLLPQKSTKKATKPKSPNLLVNQRDERRRALHMR